MKAQTRDVINSTLGTAAEMTHSLSNYGNGSMGQGICKMWSNGYWTGAASATATIGLTSIAAWFLSKDYRRTKKAELICDAYCAGAEQGLHTLHYKEEYEGEPEPCLQ